MKIYSNKNFEYVIKKAKDKGYDKGYEEGYLKGNKEATKAWEKEFELKKEEDKKVFYQLKEAIENISNANNKTRLAKARQENVEDTVKIALKIINEYLEV